MKIYLMHEIYKQMEGVIQMSDRTNIQRSS